MYPWVLDRVLVLEILMKTLLKTWFLLATLLSGTAYALPALQLGPGAGDWTYNETTQTWETTDNPLTVVAYANAQMSAGGNGDYAWDLFNTDQTVYLIVSAVPNQGNDTDAFDVTVSNDGSALTILTFGFGNPPVNDPNSLAGHSVFSTYYEVYAFDFDGSLGLIENTQPSGSGSGQGYTESIMVQINSLIEGVEGVHFDLFTVEGDGVWNPLDPENDKKLVYAFAPFSHDAEYVPEPATAALLLLGLIGFRITRRRQSS